MPDAARRYRIGYWSLMTAAFVTLFALSYAPGLRHPLGDKADHILAFGLISAGVRLGPHPVNTWRVGALCLVLVAVGIEASQHLVSPTRWSSLGDLSASILGVCAGFVIMSAPGWVARAARLALLAPFALGMNWVINVGRYSFLDWLRNWS